MRPQYKEIIYETTLKFSIEILLFIGSMFMFLNLLCLYMFNYVAKYLL